MTNWLRTLPDYIEVFRYDQKMQTVLYCHRCKQKCVIRDIEFARAMSMEFSHACGVLDSPAIPLIE